MKTSQKPPEIECALNVLKAVKKCQPDDYEALRKALPIYAVKMAQAGFAVNDGVLVHAVHNGAAFLAEEIKRLSAQAEKPRQSRSYQGVVAALGKGETPGERSPQRIALEKFWQSCRDGDLRAVKAYIKKTEWDGVQAFHDRAHGMRLAGFGAKLNVFRYMYRLGYGDIETNGSEALRQAAFHGNLAMVKYVYESSSEKQENESLAMDWAITNDHISVVRYLHKERGIPLIGGQFDHVRTAVSNGSLKSLKYLHKNGADLRANNDQPLMQAAEELSLEIFAYLHKAGADIHAHEDAALYFAVLAGNVDIVEYLYDNGVDIAQSNSRALLYAMQYGDKNMIACLEDIGLSRSDFVGDQDALLRRSDKWFEISESNVISEQLWQHNPHYFKPQLYWQIKDEMLEHENLPEQTKEMLSFTASVLFGSAENLLRYLEKWGKNTQRPLFDLLNGAVIPIEGAPDFKAWGDAALQHGQKMAALVKYADKCPVPKRSVCGRVTSYESTRDAIALEYYQMAKIYPDMAKFCFKRGWASGHFNKATGLLEKYERYYGAGQSKTGKINVELLIGGKPVEKPSGLSARSGREAIPDLTIDGKRFGKEDYHFYKLPDGDPRGLLLGEYTDNCQHIASAGAACAEYGFMCPSSGFYVVAHKQTDEIIAQSWAWRGEKAEMVFDSLEGLGDRMGSYNWNKLVKSLKYEFKKHADISAFYIGDAGHTPHTRMLCLKDLPLRDHAVPPEYDEGAYRDTKETQLRVFKRRSLNNGEVTKFNMYGR
mgnify:CR=1 FL=1|tara:strand:- start:30152 stop:32455 length:2304 start_codon:yes stop_codon:yes gene_type:complete